MAKTALSELQQQIEEVRREAFAAGYAAAIRAIRQVASRSPPGPGTSPSRGRRTESAASMRISRRPSDARKGASRKAVAARPLRGANAQNVENILQAAAPGALRPAEIRKALQQNGVVLAFTSIRHALAQLEARRAVEQVGNTRTWRHRGTSE